MQNFTLSLQRLSLTCFRNYEALRLDVTPAPIILTGANGSGKTNILEAISLLVPGRGLRRASASELQQQNNLQTPEASAEVWAVAAELRTAAGLVTIGTGRDSDNTDAERRVATIDGKTARGQNALTEHVAIACITPEMDRVLAEGPGPRRKLLDRLVYSFDPAHNGRVQRYEKALRERLRLLREGIADATWLAALENDMAQTGVAIAAARRQLLRQLRTAIAATDSAFPRADYALKGFAEEALEDQPALLVEDSLRAAFARLRGEDAQSGSCAIGPHRSDLLVTHRAKACPADLCSTGEQKALLIATILAYIRILTEQRNMTPLVLLDDIAAHLDDRRRTALFEEIRALRVQAWLTGTDTEPFMSLLPHAQHFIVAHGQLSSA